MSDLSKVLAVDDIITQWMVSQVLKVALGGFIANQI